MRNTLVLLALLTACGADADGDGYKSDVDCNDANADVNPDATEVCDGLDNNCDGTIDEDVLLTFYTDQDRDGYGDDASPVQACAAGIGQVEDNTDCDDTEDAANPGNDEICLDNIDNNCNGEVDEDAAVDASVWYADADGDGYGVDENTRTACAPGEGWAPEGGDCADDDETINPGADEICGDEIDNDCKDGPDDGGAIDAAKWHEDADNDTYGNPDVSQRACVQPEGWVADGTDCDDSDRRENPAAMWHVDADGDGFGLVDSAGNACERLNETDAPNAEDCDDEDKDINPDAEEEWYDGVDQDCSGGSDYDQDGDTYDSEEYKEGGGDCDDTNAGISPREAEIADGIDNNCDGLCDEGYISRGDLIITEVMQNPEQSSTESDGEWFEVYNDSGADLSICGGWVIADADSDNHTLTGGPYTVPKDGYFVFGSESDTTKNGGVTVDYDWSGFALANTDDEIIITFDGATIDKLGYDGGTDWPDPTGASMNLDPDYRDEADNDDGAYWCVTDRNTYGSGDLGTPGAANEECPEES